MSSFTSMGLGMVSMALADQWYNSGTFWTAAGAVAVPIMGAIATLVTLWLANPVRRLEVSMSAAPLLQESAVEMPGSLQITWDKAVLTDPNILQVNLVSRGRRDIAGDDFDQPLEFKFGAKIIAVLRDVSGPESSASPPVTFDGDLLRVGPGLVRRHQSVKITLLTAGREPEFSSATSALRDVDVEVVSPEKSNGHRPVKFRFAASLAVTAGIVGLVLAGFMVGRNHAPTGSPRAASVDLVAVSSAASRFLLTAEADLNSSSQIYQLKGINIMQHVMKTWPGEQRSAVQELAKFIHGQSPVAVRDQPIAAIVQVALNVLRNRNPANDGGTIIDLSDTNLVRAYLSGIDLDGAKLDGADFSGADLSGASLRFADLNYAFVGDTNLYGVNLDGASLAGTSFYQTILCRGSQSAQPQRGYNCDAAG